MLANTPSLRDKTSPTILSYVGPTQPIPTKSLTIRTDKPRPHMCSFCTRAFARLEHLKRHERSHTNEKPFQCVVCGRCFARRDLVLRHQQKLHQEIFLVVRSGLLPTALLQSVPESTTLTLSADNIIILQNNTSARAPLPNELSAPTPNGLELAMLLPTNNNTPLCNVLGNQYSSSFSGTDSAQAAGAVASTDMTQQPSPLTGDLPDLKDKNKTNTASPRKPDSSPSAYMRNHYLDSFINSSLSRVNSALGLRHASFSAVSGISYTNLQDTMTICSTQITDVPLYVSFAMSQMTAEEMENKCCANDFANLDLDWYQMDYALTQAKAPAPSANSGVHEDESSFKVKLNTIPSESSLPQTADSEYYNSNIIAGHQFLNPSHPHHIKGTTPLEFGYSLFTDVASVLEPKGKNIHVGTGFAHLARDSPTASSLRGRALTIMNADLKPVNMGTLADISNINTMSTMNEAEDLAWVEQIREISVPNEFPLASHNTGFEGFQYVNDQFEQDEVYMLFKLRQDDLVKQRSTVNADALDATYSMAQNGKMDRSLFKVQFTIGDTNEIITEELRARIVADSKLNDAQFPPCEDLNAYLSLYEKEFNAYYSFIHMPTLKSPKTNNFENGPLILSMCVIGALYLYHDLNTLLLFNLSKFHIHNFFETEVTVDKLQFKKVPIMVHQCLVLYIFISMFLNEPNMVEITSRQMNSMVGLIKSTDFHKPLEHFLVPPAPIKGPHDHAGIQSNYDYFIMAQTRIRTIHTFYQLEVLRSALLGCPFPMSGSEVMCGTYCNDENLWRSALAKEWYLYTQNTPGKTLLELSNNESMGNLFEQLSNNFFAEPKMSLSNSFVLIMHVHEQILKEYHELKIDIEPLIWRISHRPRLEGLYKSWASHFIRNSGFSTATTHNYHLFDTQAKLKLTIPMSLLAKMRLCVNFTPVMTQVLYKNWPGMEAMIKKLDTDIDALKEAGQCAIEVLKLWTHNISTFNDAKETSVRTPVFFVTCIFVAVVVLSKVLHVIENTDTPLTSDHAFWVSCVKVLSCIERALSPKEESSYLEFLREQSHGVFDYAWSAELKQNVDRAVRDLNAGKASALVVRGCKLWIQLLSLGVRILADAPLWPLAMGFAEALKNMATQFNENK
ncbi:hypothetical protein METBISCDRAFT_18284 [Metschnikowia bicuspidata]|uniref:C2H2-type domain-containing protein n=1 Tax=Metschnikowia bicuspidata TaxID=27322 RepID=A0A4P9ZAE0_9ASCO|nr:hypothetical protein METBISCDRAFT_18284 [Metschnikowia bicuspidata]